MPKDSLKVDLEMVRGMANRYRVCAESLGKLNTTKVTAGLADSLPNTHTGRFAAQVGERVDAALHTTGNRIQNMANVCRSAADNYQTTDEAGVERLSKEGVLWPGN